MNDRIIDLKNLLKDDPDDPFLHYSLAWNITIQV